MIRSATIIGALLAVISQITCNIDRDDQQARNGEEDSKAT
jgi:hypothetical protein